MRRYSSDPRQTDQFRVDDLFTLQSQLNALKHQQSELFVGLAQGQSRFRDLAKSVWRVQEAERRKFARDLHDGLGQNITAILHLLEQIAADPDLPAPAQRRLGRALDLCSRALYDTRNLARLLRPKILDDLGLSPALHWLARTVSDGAGFAVDVDCDSEYEDSSGDVATLVFRLAQEALNNVAKHANASHVLIKISVHDERLHLLIADDGRGCDAAAVLGPGQSTLTTGLGSMRERIALFGGTLSLISSPGDGTQLRAILPLQDGSGEG
jgi:signal transduction histidine kinase